MSQQQIEVPYPTGDGTRVIFTEPTPRQFEVLKHYLELTKKPVKLKEKAKK